MMKNEKETMDYELIFDDDGQIEIDREQQTIRFTNKTSTYSYLATAKGLQKLKGQLKRLECINFMMLFKALQQEFAV